MTQNLGKAVLSSRLLRNTEGAPPRASMLQAQPRPAGLAHHSKEHLLHTYVYQGKESVCRKAKWYPWYKSARVCVFFRVEVQVGGLGPAGSQEPRLLLLCSML